MAHQLDQKIGVMLQIMQHDHDLFFCFLVDLEVQLRADFRVSALHILTDHDQRHEQNLDNVADEQIGHKCRERVECLPVQARHHRC